MRLHGGIWAAVVMGLLGLLAANLWCWRPGIGGSRPGRPPGRPPGTEVELFYGWPATYRAEWWRADDPTLGPVLLERAPFFHPAGTMVLQERYNGPWPALADAAFALAALLAVGVFVEAQARGWRRGMAIPLLFAAAVLAGVWLVADGISIHL